MMLSASFIIFQIQLLYQNISKFCLFFIKYFMRIVVQRVFEAWVRVGGQQISRIKQGILVLVGLTHSDTPQVVQHMANKALNMRLWEKDNKSWNGSVIDIQGEVMAVSQFTLYGILKGNKPDFHSAMQAENARQMFDYFVELLRKKYNPVRIQTGKFQHLMQVGSINNGPVTIQYQKFAEQKKVKNPKQQKEKKQKVTKQQKPNHIQVKTIQQDIQKMKI